MYSIGTMSKTTGVKVPTIRYYEDIGLLSEPGRNAGNQRRYDQDGMDALGFIKHARDLGFALDDIRALMQLKGDLGTDCAHFERCSMSPGIVSCIKFWNSPKAPDTRNNEKHLQRFARNFRNRELARNVQRTCRELV